MITGPQQLTVSATLQRTFRVSDRISMDFQVNANNPINHVTFGSYNVLWAAENSLFGSPLSPNGMRSLSTLARFRF